MEINEACSRKEKYLLGALKYMLRGWNIFYVASNYFQGRVIHEQLPDIKVISQTSNMRMLINVAF